MHHIHNFITINKLFTFNGIAFKSLLIKQFTSLLLPHCLYNGVLRRCRRNGALFVENSNTINIGNALSVNKMISLPPPPQKIAYLGSRNSKNACTHWHDFFDFLHCSTLRFTTEF